MKIVVALGGNALGSTPEEQRELVKGTAKSLAELLVAGHQLIIAHGNGPQVGMIEQAMDAAHQSIHTPELPFPECGAMSQGYIGYHLQNALQSELKRRGIDKEVATIITQVVVAKDDLAFKNPTKPIGSFYDQDEAIELSREKGYVMKEDAGRGYRRVIASPQPVDVVEKKVIRNLVDQGVIVITVGGGGIPVIVENDELIGVPAVIDKDFASAKLAEIVEADCLLILTAVDRVMIDYNTPQAKALSLMTVKEAGEYSKAGHFAAGSMLPKVTAACRFAESGESRIAIIAALDQAQEALEGKSGTKIIKN